MTPSSPTPPRLSKTLPALFMLESSMWSAQLSRLGWWLLLCPPVGWLMALGYRKLVVTALSADDGSQSGGVTAAPLPSRGGATVETFRQGVGALAVIMVHFTPLVALTWTLGAADPWSGARVLDFVLYWACSFVLVPVTMGLVPMVFEMVVPSFSLGPQAGLGVALMAALTIGFIPASFMQVGGRGRYIDAMKPWRSLASIWATPLHYVSAWLISIRLTLVALSLGPLTPWGIGWSYLGIVFAFNEVRAVAPSDMGVRSWLRRLHAERAEARGRPGRLWGSYMLEETGWRQATISLQDPHRDDGARIPVARAIRLWGVWLPLPLAPTDAVSPD